MIEKPISEARNIAKSTVPKLKSQIVYKIAPTCEKFGSLFNATSGKDEI